MAITSAICTSFKQELLVGTHNFTATTGTSIVFDSAFSAGNIVEVVSHAKATTTDLNGKLSIDSDLTTTAARNKVVNKFATTFKIGGASAVPRLEVAFPTAHFEIPSHSIEDVISLETTFQALPSTIDNTNEVTLKYVGAAL